MSTNKTPTYLKWLLFEHKTGIIKTALSILGLIMSIAFTDDVLEEYNYGMPMSILILSLVSMYGFTILMTLQPYTIYRRLIKMDYWKDK